MTRNSDIVSIDRIIAAIAGCIYEIAPNHHPRKMPIIMEKAVEKLFEVHNSFYYLTGNQAYIQNLIREVLFDIPEFLELNLTQREFDSGIKPNDENREHTMAFITRYGTSINDWRDDFIDLDAVIQNVMVELFGPLNEITDK